MKKKVNQFVKGLNKDLAIRNLEQGDFTFALNVVNESDKGDIFIPGSERGNEECYQLPINSVPLGRVYIGDETEAILLVDQTSKICYIGTLSNGCEYKTHVKFGLGFGIAHQIDMIYRLRRGCEKVIYWTDGLNRPGVYNFGKPEIFKDQGEKDKADFKDVDKYWTRSKFNLQKDTKTLPDIELTTLNEGGFLEPGAVSVALQYLDEGLNPTHWVTTTEFSNIYNSSTSVDYREIVGSINNELDYYDFKSTNKSLKITIDGLDVDYPYYRLAFLHKDNGSGEINRVYFSQKISVKNSTYYYTGKNYEELGTIAEIRANKYIVSSADSIEQIDNMLLLGNLKGSNKKFCYLQRYASKISSDCVLEKIILDHPIGHNEKNPEVHFKGVGYQPGELYSFGIVYIFEDGEESPPCHIVGDFNLSGRVIWSPGLGVVPMNNLSNRDKTLKYTQNNSCADSIYWGRTRRGEDLDYGTSLIRHHRFPLRTELGIPLYELEDEATILENRTSLLLKADGCVDSSCSQADVDDGACSTVYIADPFRVRVEFTVGVDVHFLIGTIFPDEDSTPGGQRCFTFDSLFEEENFTVESESFLDGVITVVSISESDGNNNWSIVASGSVSPKGLTYQTEVVDEDFSTVYKTYSSQIMGIKFSNVTYPPVEEVGGKIVGHYFVRHERLEADKSILDSAVLTPSVKHKKYVGLGLLMPEAAPIDKTIFSIIHPEHKFNDREYTEFDNIVQQGEFIRTGVTKSHFRYLDVLDGTSYKPDRNDDGTIIDGDKYEDKDGWSLKAITRDNQVEYQRIDSDYSIDKANIDSIFYLNALENRDYIASGKVVFNTSADNKIGVIRYKNPVVSQTSNVLPYVYLIRKNPSPYSNFRNRAYYRISNVVHKEDNNVVFGGDTYLSPMRYVNTVFWDNRIARRKGKDIGWKLIAGIVLIAVGIVLSFTIPGANLAVIGAGFTLLGGGLLTASAGIKNANWSRAYGEEYDKGLRETALDDWVKQEFQYKKYDNEINKYGPEDDEIQWVGEAITDLWFESQINIGLRLGMTSKETYLHAPGYVETTASGLEPTKEIVIFGPNNNIFVVEDRSVYPYTALDRYIRSKLLVLSGNREDSYMYVGHPFGEWYDYNKDYHGMNKGKAYFHLPLEYDCCSDCVEEFPHRVQWSLQSFTEELSDYYRVLLPNNYKNISGNYGKITDLFTIQSKVYIHTEDGLFHIPQNIQERVTDEIISFIGTGTFFNIPARRFSMGEYFNAGSYHKWATVVTSVGVFFVSERDSKVYMFNGEKLEPISDAKMSSWFKRETNLRLASAYKKQVGRDFKYLNNPVNRFGIGYLATYDYDVERFILTKKDYILKDELATEDDVEFCFDNGYAYYFKDFNQIIADKAALGYHYIGMEECRMKFEKFSFSFYQYKVYEKELINNEKDVVFHLDTSTSFGASKVEQVIAVVKQWEALFRLDNPLWTGEVFFSRPNASSDWKSSQRTWDILTIVDTGLSMSGLPSLFDINMNPVGAVVDQDVIVVTFTNENGNYGGTGASSYYSLPSGSQFPATLEAPTASFISDRDSFITRYNNRINAGGSFKGLLYPIVLTDGGAASKSSKNFLLHALIALKGADFTQADVDAIPINPYNLLEEADMRAALLTSNPYTVPLSGYNWSLDPTKGYSYPGEIITVEELSASLDILLKGEIGTTETLRNGATTTREILYVDGLTMLTPYKYDKSWTMSFSLKSRSWISWHSYIPNFYFFSNVTHYSWIWKNIESDNRIWRHNVIGIYQTYYGLYYDAILEFAQNENSATTRILEDVQIHTEVLEYNDVRKIYFEKKGLTFNEAIIYNSRQCTGLVKLITKESLTDEDYLHNMVDGLDNSEVILDRNEEHWSFNNIRDIVIDYNTSFFTSNDASLVNFIYIDKVLDQNTLDFNKNWSELEMFRDKYVVIRLIFNSGRNYKILFHLSVETENESFR